MEIQINRDQHFMRLAIAKAREGIHQGDNPFGACIVKAGEVVSCEHNIVLSSLDPSAHAEVYAIRQAARKLNTVDLSGCVIYTTCEPCPMCFTACHWAGLDKIVFGTRIKDASETGFNELHISAHDMKQLGQCSLKIVGDFLREESLAIFHEWIELHQ
ncbi:MAG: nucleoside deaminase [Chroococcales cyanobacterium]